MPATHNGSAFTFDLTFSEEFGISYVTLRDDAFSVTDGEVTSARRLTQGSNIGWTITVTPDSAADVTIVLPVTTDCNARGAVCTADGRKLSNRLEFTVSGRASRSAAGGRFPGNSKAPRRPNTEERRRPPQTRRPPRQPPAQGKEVPIEEMAEPVGREQV